MRSASLPLRLGALVVAVFLVAPTLVIVPMSLTGGQRLRFPPEGLSLQWYEEVFRSGQWLDAAWQSAQVGIASALVSTVLGTMLALALDRVQLRGKSVLMAFILGPMIVPVVIVAIGVYFLFADWGLVGTPVGLIAAHATLGIPLVVITVGASLRQVDRDLERAAQSLGASPLRTFGRITLPLIAPGIFAGALFAFVTSWDEIVLAIFMTTPTFRTLPVVIWNEVRTSITPEITAISTLVLLVTSALVLIGMLSRRKDLA